jgi:diguanylate cyclase (GGDEF)-like protein/PAS domain S-box-containing protein/putative nucleotidyltransferase with HDIG domain
LDCIIRLAVLLVAAVVIPTAVRRRAGGRAISYVALTSGTVVLLAGECLRLVDLLAPEWWPGLGSAGLLLRTYAGGYVLVLVGFLSLMHDLGKAQAAARRTVSEERDHAERAHLEETKLRAVLNCASEYCIISCDTGGRITSYSGGGDRILGWNAAEAVGRMSLAQLLAQGQGPAAEVVFATVKTYGCFEAEVSLLRKGGDVFPALLSLTLLKASDGRPTGYVGIIKDIAVLKEAQNALRRERDFIRGIVETNELFILGITLADSRITMFNQGAELITGYVRGEVMGRDFIEALFPPETRDFVRQRFKESRTGKNGLVGQREYDILTKSGERRTIAWTYTASLDEAGQPCQVVGFGHDVTRERQMQASVEKARAELERANAELERVAQTDYLTGLFNRRQMTMLLEHELARSRRSAKPFCVVLMDLDHFKGVNDTYGHEAGDAALRHMAEHLRSRLRGSDVIARYGGEEFLLILPETDIDGATRVAEALRRSIQETPAQYNGTRLPLSSSFGVAGFCPGQDVQVDALVRMADEAMYSAKNLGGNRVVTWDRVQQGEVGPSLVSSKEVQNLQKRVEALSRQNHEGILQNLFRMAQDLEAANPYTVGHSVNVTEYAVAIASEMGMSPAEVLVVRRAAMLHDLGKSTIPAEIIWRNKPLSREDWALVHQHPIVSVKVIERLGFLHREALVIRHHHERPDGRGYPDGLSGLAIPVEARVIAVANAIEAMTRDRPHRPAVTLHEALAQLRHGAPQQFDSQSVAAAERAARKAGNWPLPTKTPAPVGAASVN